MYPNYGQLWDLLTDFSVIGYVKPHEKWLALSKVCLRDIADLMQTSRNFLQASIRNYDNEYEHLRASNDDSHAKLFYFRESYDYGAIALISASYAYTSFLWHFCLHVNEPEGNYDPPGYLINRVKKLHIASCIINPFISQINEFYDNTSYKFVQEYRNKWIHAGYPLIKGESRRTRRDVYSNRHLIQGLWGVFGNGWPLVASEKPEYSIYSLTKNTSKCYIILLKSIIKFIKRYTSDDVWNRYDIPKMLDCA